MDKSGRALVNPIILSGNVGEEYDTNKIKRDPELEKYKLESIIGNVEGAFSKTAQTVTYVYTLPDTKQDGKMNELHKTMPHGTSDTSNHSSKLLTLPQTVGTKAWMMLLGIGLIFSVDLLTIIFKIVKKRL
ncbi:MucBP domain-containing protein [Weissella diestrammenae]|uniref:MucBP domain-containing protein n=1 Tax=Weissella diestrammenae TaxID=1162633 RepID=A0A7G9T582_9LACO|nr:MucBP domain-containing protein [Weissella diestrammenae]MCM0583112.1 MucBP domain-containing protein [Weissella diestrammenae]QNN75257.1 MucBP domain-containing protein [Weissella diestrammenae]